MLRCDLTCVFIVIVLYAIPIAAQDQGEVDRPTATTIDEIIPLRVDEEIVGWLPANSSVVILEDRNPWIAIETSTIAKERGWVRARQLGIEEDPVDGGELEIAPSFPRDVEVLLEDLRLPNITGSTISSIGIRETRLFLKVRLINRQTSEARISTVETWDDPNQVTQVFGERSTRRSMSYTKELLELAEIDADEYSSSWDVSLAPGEEIVKWFQVAEVASRGLNPFDESNSSWGWGLRVAFGNDRFEFAIDQMLAERVTIVETKTKSELEIPVVKFDGWMTGVARQLLLDRASHLKHDPYILDLDGANLGTSLGGNVSGSRGSTQAIVVCEEAAFWGTRLQELGRKVLPSRRVAEAVIDSEQRLRFERLEEICVDPDASDEERTAVILALLPVVDETNGQRLVAGPIFSLGRDARADLVRALLSRARKSWAAEIIERAATDEEARVRTSAAKCLANCEPAMALDHLELLVTDAEASVRIEALIALTKLETSAAHSLFRERLPAEDYRQLSMVFSRLPKDLPKETMDAIISMGLEDANLTTSVLNLLIGQGRAAIEEHPRITQLAVKLLLNKQVAPKELSALKLPSISDEDRDRLIEALQIPGEGNGSDDANQEVAYSAQNRLAIAAFLGNMHCEEALDAVLALPMDSLTEVRIVSLALARIGDAKAIEPLRELYDSLDENDSKRAPILFGLAILGEENAQEAFKKEMNSSGRTVSSMDSLAESAPEEFLAAISDIEFEQPQRLSSVLSRLLSSTARIDPERFDRIARLPFPMSSFSSSYVSNRLAHEPDLESRYRVYKELTGPECQTMLGRFISSYNATYLITNETSAMSNVARFGDGESAVRIAIDTLVELDRVMQTDPEAQTTETLETCLAHLYRSLLVSDSSTWAYEIAIAAELEQRDLDGVDILIGALKSTLDSSFNRFDNAGCQKLEPLMDRIEDHDLTSDQRIAMLVLRLRTSFTKSATDVDGRIDRALTEGLALLPDQFDNRSELDRHAKWIHELVVEQAARQPKRSLARVELWDRELRKQTDDDVLCDTYHSDAAEYVEAQIVQASDIWSPAYDVPMLEPTAGDLRRVAAAKGLMTNQFILLQAMPWGEFQQFAERVRAFQFSPLHIRPFRVNGELTIAAIFRRDVRPWGWILERDPGEVRELNLKLLEQGKVVSDLIQFRNDANESYLVVWHDMGELARERSLSVGVRSANELSAVRAPERDVYPVSCQTYRSEVDDGSQDCVIWRRTYPTQRQYASIVKGDRTRIGRRSNSYIIKDFDAIGEMESGLMGYCLVQAMARHIQQVVMWERSPDDQIEKAVFLAQAGYLPQAITVTQQNEEAPLISTIAWSRPAHLFDRLPKTQTDVFQLEE